MCNLTTGSTCAGGHAADKASLGMGNVCAGSQFAADFGTQDVMCGTGDALLSVTGSCALPHCSTSAGSIAEGVTLRPPPLGPAVY